MEGRPEPVAEHIWRVTNATFGTNSYICRTENDDECVLIDPGLEGDWVEAAVDGLGLRPTAIFCTHGHFDHIGSVSRFTERGATWHLHPDDIVTAQRSNFMMMAFNVKKRIQVPAVDVEVTEGFQLKVGAHQLQYIETPGHTPGSCAIRWGPHLFTGDTLYARGVGLSKLPGADDKQLRDSVRKIFRVVDPETLALPGHGDTATLADIHQHNRPLHAFLDLEEDDA